MFVDEKVNSRSGDLYEDVSREDIVSAFRSAMIGHFRSHVPGTNINESTLLASDYLNHFHELVMLLEAISSEPKAFADDLLSWRPLTYEEHFTESGFRRLVQYESTHARTASMSGDRPLPSRTLTGDPRSMRSRTVAWLARHAAT